MWGSSRAADLMAGDIFPKRPPGLSSTEMQPPGAASPEEAAQMAQQYMKLGLDGINCLPAHSSATVWQAGMDTDIVKAVAGCSERLG